MKKKTKGIIAGSCAVAVMAGVLVVLQITAPEKEPEEDNLASTSDTSDKTSRLLYDKNPSDILSLKVTNENGGYTIERYADDFWTVPDISGLPVSTGDINSAVEALATVTAEETVSEAPEDLSIYGLDKPQITAEAVFDGSSAVTRTLSIGDETPKGGYYYFTIDGDSTVYTIKASAVSILFNKEYDFLNHVIYENVVDDNTEDDYNPAKINKVTIQRHDIDYDIVLEYDTRQDDPDAMTGNSSTHVLTEPVSLDLNPDKSNNVLNGIMGLTADDVAAVNPDEKMLEEYGFKEPACTVVYDINAGGITLHIGGKKTNDEGLVTGYYVMKDGTDIIYTVNSALLPWLKAMPLDLTTTLVTSVYIYTIHSIDMEYEGNTLHFDLEGGADDFKVKCGGEDYTDTDRFKTFYQFILRAPAEELYLEEETGEPRIKLTIESDFGTNVIEFITSADRKSVIKLNGRTSFKCRTAYVDRLIENIENLLNKEKIITSW